MKHIQLTKGYKSLVDDEDYEWLSKMKFFVSHTDRRTIYAVTHGGPNVRNVYMHRLIIKPGKDLFVDHINGNGLDNRKSNLRICTKSQNAANVKLRAHNKCGYIGVHCDANGWRAQIQSNYKRKAKRFRTAKEAAIQYNEWAKETHGEFARLNKLDEPEEKV